MRSIAFIAFGNVSHIYHIATTAVALSLRPNIAVTIYIAEGQLELTNRIGRIISFDQCCIEVLKPSLIKHVIYGLKKKVFFANHLVKRHCKQLLSPDVVISTDFCQQLLDRRQDISPLIIFCSHGAGDRDYPLRVAINQYDRIIMNGKKLSERLRDEVGVNDERIIRGGYPKFDITRKLAKPKIFDNANPVFIYAPHFDLSLSSIVHFSSRILDFFIRNPHYNLIYSPHCLISSRVLGSILTNAHHVASNIFIDVDPFSEARSDMRNMMAADAYIGDVSSQVYEFLIKPRPCLFLNAFQLDWHDDPNYASWHLGSVIDHPDQFAVAITKLLDNYSEDDRLRQEAAFKYSFGKVGVHEGEFMAGQLISYFNSQFNESL